MKKRGWQLVHDAPIPKGPRAEAHPPSPKSRKRGKREEEWRESPSGVHLRKRYEINPREDSEVRALKRILIDKGDPRSPPVDPIFNPNPRFGQRKIRGEVAELPPGTANVAIVDLESPNDYPVQITVIVDVTRLNAGRACQPRLTVEFGTGGGTSRGVIDANFGTSFTVCATSVRVYAANEIVFGLAAADMSSIRVSASIAIGPTGTQFPAQITNIHGSLIAAGVLDTVIPTFSRDMTFYRSPQLAARVEQVSTQGGAGNVVLSSHDVPANVDQPPFLIINGADIFRITNLGVAAFVPNTLYGLSI